jgi:hypothetical protein
LKRFGKSWTCLYCVALWDSGFGQLLAVSGQFEQIHIGSSLKQ